MSKSVDQIRAEVVESVAETTARGAEKLAEGSERLAEATKKAASKTRTWADDVTGARNRRLLFTIAALSVVGLLVAIAAYRRDLSDAKKAMNKVSDSARELARKVA